MKKIGSYAVVTASYWAFMLTDGALRMLVLLYFHNLGYSPVTLAFLFLFYEFFGIVTNLFGGWLGQHYGLKSTLIAGLIIQPVALVALSFMNSSWSPAVAIPFVMIIQALSGIAKDLTKMSSKTAVKFLIPEDQSSTLFKWVSVLTGSKNAIKGFGFFLGGFLLQQVGFRIGLWSLASLVITVLFLSIFLLPDYIGKSKIKINIKSVFKQNRQIKILSGARVFLFASRDIWFVVAIPVFLASAFGWNYSQVGGFMAFWVIGYGIVQSLAPVILKKWTRGSAPTGKAALIVSLLLAAIMASITVIFSFGYYQQYTIIIGLLVFGAVFALNSSVHSFLVLEYAEGDKAAMNVGFYYMANAAGRLIGTLLSGLLFQYGGALWALMGSTIFLLFCSAITRKLTAVN